MKHFLLAACCFILLPTSFSRAADLIDYVGSEAGLCVLVDDVPQHADELKSSELVRRIQKLPLYQQWLEGNEYQKLRNTLDELESILGDPIPNAALNLAGRQTLFAVYPKAEGGPSGILMSQPSSFDEAQRLMDLWHVLENADVTQQEGGYWKRTTHKKSVYYILEEGFFALSDKESAIRDLTRRRKQQESESVTQLAAWQKSVSVVDERSWARVWFRPQLWGGVISLPEMEGAWGILLDQLKRAECLVAELDTDTGVHVRLHLIYKEGREPEVLQQFRRQHPADASEDFVSEFSSETLAAVFARGGFDLVGRWLDRVESRSGDKEQSFLRSMMQGLLVGRDPYLEVLPLIGKEWLLELRRGDSQSPQPMNVLLSASFHEEKESPQDEVTLQVSLGNLLQSGLEFLAISETGKQVTLERNTLPEGGTVTSYASRLGFHPTYALTQDRVFLGSDEERVRQALVESSENEPYRTQFQQLLSRSINEAHVGILMNMQTIRELLADQPMEVLQMLRVPEHKQSETLESFRKVRELSQIMDGGYGYWCVEEGKWSLSMGVLVEK